MKEEAVNYLMGKCLCLNMNRYLTTIRKGFYAVSFGVSETAVLAGLGQLREEACFRSCFRIIANTDRIFY